MGTPLVFLTVMVLRAAGLVFVAGIAWRVVRWSAVPVPFRIPVTCGQQASLPWLKPARLDNPATTPAVVGRMLLEVLLFRSLFRNVRARTGRGPLSFALLPNDKTASRKNAPDTFVSPALGLWLAALAFHYSLLVILVRHLRFFLQPVPGLVSAVIAADSFLQIGLPTVHTSTVIFPLALAYLLGRRVASAEMRYISRFSDYALLVLLVGIASTGILMRHVVHVDAVAVKQLALAVVTFSGAARAATPPSPLHWLVFVHLAFVAMLVACLPFTKLVHMAGIFLSPTRNLANSSRARRHVNPWNGPASVHAYGEWETEFRDKMIAAGIPVEPSSPDGAEGAHV